MNAKTIDVAASHTPTENEIREHAYHLFEQRGRTHGHDVDDWITAERQLTAHANAAATVAPRWRWHYRTLLRLRDALLVERNEHDQASRVPFDRTGDPVDVANEKQEHDTLLAEIRREDTEVAEIDAALRRIRDGTYGICEMTGRPIGDQRLRVLPWTRLSHDAAEQLDAARKTKVG